MKEKDYKEETFTSWFELITLLEYLALTRVEFKEILIKVKKRYHSQKVSQNVDLDIHVKDVGIFNNDNVFAEVIHKWLEAIVYSYKFLQYARSIGGTYGHKVGPIWRFLKDTYEIYEKFLQDESDNFYK
jgi:hypothetical protein